MFAAVVVDRCHRRHGALDIFRCEIFHFKFFFSRFIALVLVCFILGRAFFFCSRVLSFIHFGCNTTIDLFGAKPKARRSTPIEIEGPLAGNSCSRTVSSLSVANEDVRLRLPFSRLTLSSLPPVTHQANRQIVFFHNNMEDACLDINPIFLEVRSYSPHISCRRPFRSDKRVTDIGAACPRFLSTSFSLSGFTADAVYALANVRRK